ncbi:MAG: CHASE2 domain-containing protein [Scytonema sp. PMC 1070.18]|nr:CHASE2 domain-containing protein [Scytonema sp. PMC 1070.18]
MTIFKLKVSKFEQCCNFELSWGQGKRIPAQLNYPKSLENSYIEWRQAYLNCYENLRGKVEKKGKFKAPLQDYQGKLGKAEADFLSKFNSWLRNEKLYDIRETITNATRDNKPSSDNHWVDILLTCDSPELTRLPWEVWEINTKLSKPGSINIRLARVPSNIRNSTVSPVKRKARVLAILGDDKGLNFEEDKQALRAFSKLTEVEFIGWEPGKDIAQLKQEIAEKISEPKGWDILFFAGHSNETPLTGGDLKIAPNSAIAIQDIAKPLQQARDRGLQFAIFNSCSGISIAESLINLGLPQVAVMREPIHNNVAQEFLVEFLNGLAEYKDVHEALIDACVFLKETKEFIYPSTYLIPSLFRHPQSELFRLEPFGIWHSIKSCLPTKKEAIYLTAFLSLSLIPPIQDLLLEPRLLLQAAYRQVIQGSQNSLPPPNQKSPILLVQIDDKSLEKDKVEFINERYMNYSYLGKIIDKLVERNARVIGVDYILDKDKQQPENSQKLQRTVSNAIDKGTWFIWGADETENYGVSPEIANLNQSSLGDINSYKWYVELPKNNCSETCPFPYVLALSHSLVNQNPQTNDLPQPQLSKTDFRDSIILERDKEINFLQKLIFSRTNNLLQWFQPIIDYSIPPKQAYQTISACELLGSCTPTPGIVRENLKSKIAIIAAGGYKQAGVDEAGEDNDFIPLPIAFWRGEKGWNDVFDGERSFTGGEAHAYTVHHLLNQHLVIAISNFIMVLIASVFGKIIVKILQNNPRRMGWELMIVGISSVVYILVSLQVYISFEVLVPIVFPFVVFGNYMRLGLGKS